MKIAFIVNIFPAMSESFILNQITGLTDMGHQVEIFAEENPKESKIHDDVRRYNLLNKTHYIPAVPSNKAVLRLKTLWLIFINFFRAPVRTAKALKFNLSRPDGFCCYELYFVFAFAGKNFDILQCHFGRAGNIGVMLRQAGLSGRLVTAFHGYDVTAYVRRHGPGIYNKLFQTGDMFTYNSDATKEKLINLGAPAEKLFKIPMGIDVDKIPFAERRPAADGEIRLLSVGRLVEMKGREYAVRAVAKLVSKFPNISYTIAGDGPLREPLGRLVDELGLAKTVHFAGWVDDAQLDALYKNSHIFVHPSVTAGDGNMEGQGVVLLEAQTYGLPVIATKHNAFTETVLDGKSGILVPERDTDALAEAMEELISNPQRWPDMGAQGRKHAEEHYNLKILNKKLADLYKLLFPILIPVENSRSVAAK